MRLKQFIIFIIIFTIIYVAFFIIVDIRKKKILDKNEKKKIESLLQNDKFYLFARFYGLSNTTVTKDLLHTILNSIKNATSISLTTQSNNYQITIYELILTVLYFENYHLIGRKDISIESDVIQKLSARDQSLILKYGIYFQTQKTYQEIINTLGNEATEDLKYINNHYLFPGVRIIDSNIYYFEKTGDSNEK